MTKETNPVKSYQTAVLIISQVSGLNPQAFYAKQTHFKPI